MTTLILAHLRSKGSHNEPVRRLEFNVQLVRLLYNKGWQADDVRNLFRFIDWVMDLPDELHLHFMNEIQNIEAENQMPYITSVERIAKAEGKAEGKIQLLQELLGIPVSTDMEIDSMTAEGRDALLAELRERLIKR